MRTDYKMINPKIGDVIFYGKKESVVVKLPLRLDYFMQKGKEFYSIYFIPKEIFDYSSSLTTFSLICRYYPELFYLDVDRKKDKKKGTDIEQVKIFAMRPKEKFQKIINFIKKRNKKVPSKANVKIVFNRYIPLEKLMKKVKNEIVAEKI